MNRATLDRSYQEGENLKSLGRGAELLESIALSWYGEMNVTHTQPMFSLASFGQGLGLDPSAIGSIVQRAKYRAMRASRAERISSSSKIGLSPDTKKQRYVVAGWKIVEVSR